MTPTRASGREGGARGIVRVLLRVPLFYKILIANAVIVVLGAIAGTMFSIRYIADGAGGVTPIGWAVVLAVTGVAVTVLVNAMILRLALEPLEQLESTAERVRSGDLDARAPGSRVADRGLERLTGTFNAMLDTLEVYRQRLRDVAARALSAEEEERKRIARELHDDTAQTLAALLIRLRLARAADDSESRDRMLDELREELSGALDRIRRFARGLRPPALDELGLVPALESHIRGLAEALDRPIRLEVRAPAAGLEPHAELALYRITQEALSNAIRHADASEIVVAIDRVADGVRVRIRDDGAGFDVGAMAPGHAGGLGLFGMRERAAYVGGRVEIDSVRGRGTEVSVTVPSDFPGGDSRSDR